MPHFDNNENCDPICNKNKDVLKIYIMLKATLGFRAVQKAPNINKQDLYNLYLNIHHIKTYINIHSYILQKDAQAIR